MSNDLSVNMRLAENRRRDDERRRAAAAFVPSTETVRSEYGNSSAAARATFDRWLAEHDREVAEEAWASVHAHLDLALTGSRSPDEATWPGYWEAKQHALDETTARPLSANVHPETEPK